MTGPHLAFDFGAGSGRAILGRLDLSLGKLETKEVSRFPNDTVTRDGHLHWDIEKLFKEVRDALKACAAEPPASIGVDTWGVDFGLLDGGGNLLCPPFAYRDRRTDGAMESFFKKMPPEELYRLTGVQFMQINSVFQLESMVRDHSPLLEKAASLLFMPDLFHHMLTGLMGTEATFATTSALYNPVKAKWEPAVLRALGLPERMMQKIVRPGTPIGELSGAVQASTGLPATRVVAVATHDTGSAVAAVPATGHDWAFLSSGTWSLLGLELPKPVINEKSRALNFTNEGGVGGTTRFLKNITGMWLLEECRRIWARERRYSYPELAGLAKASPPFAALVDPDRPEFLNPADMPEAIRSECRRTGQEPPATVGAFARCIFESLALKYRLVLDQARRLTGRKVSVLHVIGGGSMNDLLCSMTADSCDIPVVAGPAEATCAGNLLMQAMALGSIRSLEELRTIASRSFSPVTHAPGPRPGWEDAFGRFSQLLQR